MAIYMYELGNVLIFVVRLYRSQGSKDCIKTILQGVLSSVQILI
jgi:hypothetical protein